jgi:lysophospholipase L1-like esterase
LFAAVPAKRRIAVVGDSFTFGLEVRYEDTWPYQLERALGPEFRVLNLGVDGYGVDQAFLRYRRDVLAWRPEPSRR